MSLTLRPEVAAFAQLMERVLRENDHKGGWKDCSSHDLYNRLIEEAEELAGCLNSRRASVEDIAREAADVANFAMMIADVCGGLQAALERAEWKEGLGLKLHIKNQLAYVIEFCCGEKEYVLQPDEQITIEVNDEDCMYLDGDAP